jgi:hypothetical protein
VFGSSRPVPDDPEYRLAHDVGRELAAAGFVVCNGGYGGMMEASARGAKEAPSSPVEPGRRTIGVIASAFAGRSANRWIDRVIVVDSMVDRLLKLISLGDAYVVLKGGTGTLLEFAAVWEFMNKRVMQEKPIVIVGPFWDGVVKTLRDELAWEGLTECTKYVTVTATPAECARVLRSRFSDR